MIFGGTVEVSDANAPGEVLATGTTNSADGSFDLSISPSLNFEGGVLKITVKGNPTATMVCDAQPGCNGTPFGSTVEIGEDFQLSALVPSPENNSTLTVNVNALTTFATRYTEDAAQGRAINATDVAAGDSRAAALFGLPQVRLSSIENVDITRPDGAAEASEQALRVAMINAGILEAMLREAGTPEERLLAILGDFSENGGQLRVRSGTAPGQTFGLEAVFLGAFQATAASPVTSPAKDMVAGKLEQDYLAAAAAVPGQFTSDLPVRPLLTASTTALSFEGVAFRGVPSLPITISGDGVPWTISSDVPWLSFNQTSGTGNATVRVAPYSGLVNLGRSSGSFVISDSQSPRQIRVDVTFFLQDALRAAPSGTIRLMAGEGATTPITTQVRLTGQNVTWQAASDQSWARAVPASGTSPSEITVEVDPTGLPEGRHIAEITVSDTVYNQQVRLPVELTLEPRRITVGETGVSFSRFPGSSILERDIMVSENAGEPLGWTAQSSASWLSVTPSGETGWVLTLRADPSGLASDTVHTARVEVRATDPAVANTETIEVGLWVGTTDPEPLIDIDLLHRHIIADPVRPYVYVSKGSSGDVDIINIYTGEVAGVIEDVAANSYTMAITPDGRRLFVVDANNSVLVPVDLANRTVLPAWPAGGYSSMAVGRVDGKTILFTGSGHTYDLDTGTRFVNPDSQKFIQGVNSVAVSRNGERVCQINRGLSPYSLYCFDTSYSYLEGGRLIVEMNGNVAHGVGSNGQDVALSNDGSRVFAASGAPYEFLVFDSKTLQQVQRLPADPYPNNAEVDLNDVFYGGIRGSGVNDIWAYDSLGNLRGTYGSSGDGSESIFPGQMVISGNGSRLIGTTEAYILGTNRIFILSTE